MKIDTTVSITNKNLELLERYADNLKINRNDLIILLLKKFHSKFDGSQVIFKQISYQKRDGVFKKRKHIWISPELYEKCMDLKKALKYSLSLIIRIAIEKYINEIDINFTDNYHPNYIAIVKKYDNCYSMEYIQDYPGKKVMKEILIQ